MRCRRRRQDHERSGRRKGIGSRKRSQALGREGRNTAKPAAENRFPARHYSRPFYSFRPRPI
jgi:hypothetical protein